MTETTDKKKLPAAVERFILHWGDMGDEWGVNRSVSQIHGLLYLAEAPMTAEDIAETLGMARSNVSNSIKELLGHASLAATQVYTHLSVDRLKSVFEQAHPRA